MKFILKASILIMLYKQDNSGKKIIYWGKLHGGIFTEWNNFKSGRSNLAIAGENNQHLRHQQWFTREMTSEKRAQKFHTMTSHFPDLG